MQLGEEFERFVAGVRAQNHDPRRVHLAMTEYYVHVAHARLHQCLRASPAERAERLAVFEASLADLRKAARVPLLRAHLVALRAQLEWMQSKWDVATRSFAEAERMGLEENAPWVLYTVHRGRAHMLLARGKPDIARDEAALAEALAARHGAVHRVRFVREEFGKGIVPRADQPVTSSLSLLLGAASSSERGSSHSTLRPRGYLKALQRITRASRGELDPARQSQLVLDEILAAMRAELGMLLVMREDSPEPVETLEQLSVAAVRGDDAGGRGSFQHRALVDRALRSASAAMSGERRPAIAVPLLVRETPVGAVYLERAAGGQAFTDGDAEMLHALAAQVPGALELARMLYERERAAETARITDKMGALARFARGVSHDISNLFQQVLVTTEWLSDQDADAELGEQLGGIRESIRRAARLTERLNAFARSGTHAPPQALDLEGEIDAIKPVLESVLGGGVELEIAVASGLWQVKIDSAQLDQMLLNLASNARDAMPGGGRLSLELQNVVLDESFMSEAPWVGSRECVEILVSDSGTGMDAETCSHMFEPYFTSKEPGRGLGLATVYGVVRQNGGHIEVESEVGAGTTFRIRLPRCVGVAPEKPRRREAASVTSGTFMRTLGGDVGQPGRRVLVVDDEPEVNAALCRMLQYKGYEALPALSAAEALELFHARSDEIDAVVTDLVMPGMNGLELCRQIEKVRSVPAIVVSGASDDVIVAHGLAGAVNFLPKPVFPNDLDAKLRAALRAVEASRQTGAS
jgi:signal transduction histidine kinase/CheY-like chemotaxis protein